MGIAMSNADQNKGQHSSGPSASPPAGQRAPRYENQSISPGMLQKNLLPPSVLLPLPLTRNPSWTPDQAAIAARFAEQLRSEPERAWHAYRQMPETDGGRTVNVDLARLLCPEYACRGTVDAVRHARTRLTPATYGTAKAFCDAAFATLLISLPQTLVLFSSGGPASGKTTALRLFAEAEASIPGSVAPIIYDTAFSNLTTALRDIDRCGLRPVRIV